LHNTSLSHSNFTYKQKIIKSQKIIVGIIILTLLFMMLFPPFHEKRGRITINSGYSFIFSPPSKYATVNIGLLIVQWCCVLMVGCGLLFLFKKKYPTNNDEDDIIILDNPIIEDEDKVDKNTIKFTSSSQLNKTLTNSKEPRGVGGWLLFFCITLTILSPLFTIGRMNYHWGKISSVFAVFPNSFKTAILLECSYSITILVYGFIVGIMIWTGNSSGRNLAKQYLLIRFFSYIAVEMITLLMISDLPSYIFIAVATASGKYFFSETVFFLSWWFYFKNSKRVRNTYVSLLAP